MKKFLSLLVLLTMVSCGANPSGGPVAGDIAAAEPGSDSPYVKRFKSFWYTEKNEYSLNLSEISSSNALVNYWIKNGDSTCKMKIGIHYNEGIEEFRTFTMHTFNGDCQFEIDGVVTDLYVYDYLLGYFEKSDTELTMVIDQTYDRSTYESVDMVTPIITTFL